MTEIFLDDWSDDSDWVEIADRLCAVLDLPDLTTRSGLKKVHADLDDIHYRLDETFRHARRTGHAKVMGGIVSIYTKMSLMDLILQDKLVEGGFFEKMISLTASPDTVYVALRALNAITHDSGKRTKYEFMRQAPTLLKLLQEHLDDPQATGLLTSISAHASLSMPTMATTFDVSALASTLLDSLRNPATLDWTFGHAVHCLTSSTFDMAVKCRDLKSYTTFRVALLRSKNVMTRMKVMSSLLASHNNLHTLGRGHFCSTAIPSALQTRELPDHLAKIVDAYGRDRCQMFIGRRANAMYISLLAQHELDPNLLRLGRTLVTEVQNTQYFLTELLCTCCGRQKFCADCAQLWKWPKLAFQCAAALRSQARASDDLFADILEWKYLTARDDCDALINFLKKAIIRHPNYALLYYALVTIRSTKCDADTLRLLKKGLACHDIAPWMRYALLAEATDSALNCALTGNIQDAGERCALLVSAYEDSKKYMTEAPPDDIRRQFVLSEHIIATFLVEGPKCTPHTPNIAHALREIKMNKRFMEFLDHPETNTSYPVLACQKVIAVVKGATEEWSDILKRTDEAYLFQCEGRPLLETADGASEALSAWYKKFESDTHKESGEIEDHSHPIERTRALEDFLSPAKVTIMQCTWCSRPSALLKKCKQCGKVKYCDSECQKAHWKKGHKSVCASSVAPVPRQ